MRIVAEGMLEPVEYSDWAAPIVAGVKSDRKSVRICGDFCVTVDPISKLHGDRSVCHVGKRKDLYQGRLESSIPAAKAGCRVSEVRSG